MFEFLTLPERTTKPRESGLTHVLDKGLSLDQVRQFLEVAGDYVDIVKLGWGTAVVTPNVKEKIALYQSFGIPVCFGGTFFEVCLRQGKFEEYLALVDECGMDCVEISDGTVAMDEDDKLAILRTLSKQLQGPQRGRQQGRGRGDHARPSGSTRSSASSRPAPGRSSPRAASPAPWASTARAATSRTACWRRSATAFDTSQILFEAPIKKQQAWFIKQFGANVNLGNIPPEEVISVETLRVGVRGDTLLTFH